MQVHRTLVTDDPEQGIFNAQGRGLGFGLIAEQHRTADAWKDYPPGLFLSPAIVGDARPQVAIKKVWPARPIAVQRKGEDPLAVRGTMVELLVTYPDPLTAPLALRPNEVWWATGTVRRYGPVRTLRVRFVVVTGLRQHGYPMDAAVVNEALTDTPQIPGTRYGLDQDNIGRAFDRPGDSSSPLPVNGGLVLGSVRWWTKADAADRFAASLERARHLPDLAERLALLRRLLLVDPEDTETNALLGGELYRLFLAQGLSKSGINALSEAVRSRLAELYWNIQAPTWRQELTATATGNEPAADALYGALGALEVVASHRRADAETRRRLGALYRWNGDAEEAVRQHEGLLAEVLAAEPARRGALLSELAWDRIQWLAWNRRYEHPWLGQATREAEQALELAESPLEKVVAAHALLTLEALSPDRKPEALQARLRTMKEWHDRLAGVAGVWAHLVGNDLVKALVPEGAQVTLPTPVRSPEVLDVAVHASPPAQDLLRAWDFDREPPGAAPHGFLLAAWPNGSRADWRIVADPQAPSAPHVLAVDATCAGADCVQMILTDEATFDYVDVVVRLKLDEHQPGRAGIVVGGRDKEVFYAATVNAGVSEVAIYRIERGAVTLLGAAPVRLGPGAWRLLRLQRENFAHLSRPRLALFLDGTEVLAVANEPIWQGGRVGLVTMGTMTAAFDAFHILRLVSNEPLSPAAAY